MSYKERYRIEKADEIRRTERRVNRVGWLLGILFILSMLTGIIAIGSVDGNTPVSFVTATLSFAIMSACFVGMGRLDDEGM